MIRALKEQFNMLGNMLIHLELDEKITNFMESLLVAWQHLRAKKESGTQLLVKLLFIHFGFCVV